MQHINYVSNIDNLTVITDRHASETEIGKYIKDTLLSIPAGRAIVLHELASALQQRFNLNQERAYMRIQVLFSGGKGTRKWAKHLIKMQGGPGNYVHICNTNSITSLQ